jgi:hypothetical protein
VHEHQSSKPQLESLSLPVPSIIEVDSSSESECGYRGGVNHIIISSDDDGVDDGEELGWDAGCESVEEFDEADIQEMKKRAQDFHPKPTKNLYDKMNM